MGGEGQKGIDGRGWPESVCAYCFMLYFRCVGVEWKPQMTTTETGEASWKRSKRAKEDSEEKPEKAPKHAQATDAMCIQAADMLQPYASHTTTCRTRILASSGGWFRGCTMLQERNRARRKVGAGPLWAASTNASSLIMPRCSTWRMALHQVGMKGGDRGGRDDRGMGRGRGRGAGRGTGKGGGKAWGVRWGQGTGDGGRGTGDGGRGTGDRQRRQGRQGKEGHEVATEGGRA